MCIRDRASTECPIHDNYKQAILKAKDNDTIVTGRIAGTPVRVLKNEMSREYVTVSYTHSPAPISPSPPALLTAAANSPVAILANIATGEFAAAVSNAGGLGLIGAGECV